MQVLYSSERTRTYRVVAVFVGGREIPDRSRCETVLAMDPEVETPVPVIPFGGVESMAVGDASSTIQVFAAAAPEYLGDGFSYRCTRILDLLLVKVLVRRPSESDLHPH